MTECERIIEQGILPASFFEEEERCDFLVTTERKNIWAIEIDLFLKFAEVCEKYGFRYYAIFGTLLGAIRHIGMIPWDDDMDVCMPREDYDKFCKLCVADFEDPYLLQTPYTDKGYYYSFAKVRNVNTTCMPIALSKAGFCHGIHIDIFPLDYCNPETYETDRGVIYESIMKCSSYMKAQNDNLDEIQLQKLKMFHTNDPLAEYEKVQRIACNPDYLVSSYVGTPVNTILRSSQMIWRAEDFADCLTVSFEGIPMRIPVGYENILHATYGDYMQFPPMENRGVWHSGVIWNPDKSYIDYLND